MRNNIEKISRKELALYKPMQRWFSSYLQNKNPDAEVVVYDVHKIYLSDFFTKVSFRQGFPDYSTYRIKIDLLGIINRKGHYDLVFIEVKDGALNFSHLAQLLVYSKLVRPAQSVLISSRGLSTHLNDIINKHHRSDMLEYTPNRKIKLAKWDEYRGAIFQ